MTGGAALAILAAGSASRFGGGKLGADLQGKPLLSHILDTAHDLNLATAVILRTGDERYRQVLDGDQRAIMNDRAGAGMGTSLALAAEWAIEREAGALVVTLGDMPFVDAAFLKRLARIGLTGGIAAARYPDGSPGPPAVIPASAFGAIARLPPASGAKRWLQSRADAALIECNPNQLFDIDTRGDLASAQAMAAQNRTN